MSALPSSPSAQTFAKPSDVYIHALTLNDIPMLNYAECGITGFEITLREDIFSPFVTGSIVLTDTHDAFRYFQLTGNDDLLIQWTANRQIMPLNSYRGILQSYSDYNVFKAGVHAFKGNITSVDAWNDSCRRISRTFTGTPDEIAKLVCSEYLSQSMTVDPCPVGQTHKFISPYMKPSEIESYMAGRAINKDGFCGYRFFQSITNGYYFAPPAYFLRNHQTHTLTKIRYSLTNYKSNAANNNDYLDQLQNTENVIITQLLPSMEAVNSGMYGIDLKAWDITHKSLINKKLESRKSVAGNPMAFINASDTAFVDPLTNKQPRFLLGQQGAQDVYDSPEAAFKYGDKTKYQTIMDDQMNRSCKMRATIFGASDITVGDNIQFDLPVPANQGVSFDQSKIHAYINGTKWLVTSVIHQFGGPRLYVQHIELCRDGFESGVL